MRNALVTLAAAVIVLTPAVGEAQQRERLDVGVFARIGPPGQPEPVAIGPDRTVYVGTNQQERGDSRAPSKVFAFSPEGRPLRSYEIRGQKLDEDHGIQGLAFDGDGLLYALDRAAEARVVLLDPRTGAQRDYATFDDVPSCSAARTSHCSATLGDMPAGPNFAAFAPDGTLYVTDIDQALIWRVPPGGGKAQVWFTDQRLESVFGPNGIQFMADGRTLLFAVTGSGPWAGGAGNGTLYTLPVRADGRPGELTEFWRSRPLDAPDGLAIARSGNVYVAMAGSSQLVALNARGEETDRIPESPLANRAHEVPFDAPASLAFLDRRLLVSNQSYPAGDSAHWAVLDVFADEEGLPLHRPIIRPRAAGGQPPSQRPRQRLRVRVTPRRVRAGVRHRLRFTVTAHRGKQVRRVAGARVSFAGRSVITDRRGRARMTVRLRVRGVRTAVARKRGYTAGRASVRATRVRR